MKQGALGIAALVLAAVGAVAVAITFAGGTDAEPNPGEQERALPVRVVRASVVEGFEIFERLAGRVVSRRSGALGFERSGRIAHIAAREGDRVEAGAVLAQLDTRELTAQRRELAARVRSTRARQKLAKLTVGRQNELRDADFLSPQSLDEAVANERSLSAELEADRAALQRVDVALELSQVRAPYALLVSERVLDEGTVVMAGQKLFSVLEDAPQRVEIGVPPELAARLELGGSYQVETDVGMLSARLDAVIPEIDPTTRTQTAILDVDADQPRVADGSLARVRFERRVEARGSWVPVGALTEGRRGTWTAFAVVRDPEGTPRIERRQVEVIHNAEDRVFVRGTLRDGDAIVVDGVHRLAPGLRVRVEEPLAQNAATR